MGTIMTNDILKMHKEWNSYYHGFSMIRYAKNIPEAVFYIDEFLIDKKGYVLSKYGRKRFVHLNYRFNALFNSTYKNLQIEGNDLLRLIVEEMVKLKLLGNLNHIKVLSETVHTLPATIMYNKFSRDAADHVNLDRYTDRFNKKVIKEKWDNLKKLGKNCVSLSCD